jgi:hypothetical protein
MAADTRFTLYPVLRGKEFGPRCRNAYTLVPLFPLHVNNVMQTSAQPIFSVPKEYFWQNSHGYGFDIRNISVLLRVNFRNLNPHDIREPIWCSASDLMSLLNHPNLNPSILANLKNRNDVLMKLSDTTKKKLAYAAQELYSFSLQGFYNWVADAYDTTLAGLITTSRTDLLHNIALIHQRKRETAIMAIQQHSKSQAAEHRSEPAEINHNSELYEVLEIYKARVAQETLDYIQTLKDRQLTYVNAFNTKLRDYMHARLAKILHRYTKRASLLEKKHNDELVLVGIHLRTTHTVSRVIPASRRPFTRAVAQIASSSVTELHHVRIVYRYGATDPLQVVVDNVPLTFKVFGDVFMYLEEIIPLWRGGKIEAACLAGGLVNQTYGAKWHSTIKRDNNFIHSMVTMLLLPASLGSTLTNVLTAKSQEWNVYENQMACLQAVGGQPKDSHVGDLINEFLLDSRSTFEYIALDKWTISGGYDLYEGNLRQKLQTALNRQTCIQDVAAELCESLSLPYPPESAHIFSTFQCDHTNIPPALVTTEPVEQPQIETMIDNIADSNTDRTMVWNILNGIEIDLLFNLN